MSDALWSGWGVRTMSVDDAGYNPLSYHNGTVWPHDTSLAAWGLARAGRWAETRRIVQTLLEAARFFDWSLPEVFAGFSRSETPFPIAYPTAARPQAWAAGTPVLLLRLLLGLEPDTERQTLRTIAPGGLPTLGRTAAALGRARVRAHLGRARRRRPGARRRGIVPACAWRSSARCGSRCRPPATVASNGSSRSSRTGSPTPGTT